MAKKLFVVAAILISFFSLYPLTHNGIPPTHDGEYHVVRFYEFNKALTGGDLYPRWAHDLNSGFGVPLFNYVYPLPNYFSSFLHLFGFSFIDAFKLNMFVAGILGSIFMFFWAREFWGDWGGLVASSFYSFSPYHLLDIYIRGSVGEVWALALFPGFLFFITKTIKEKNKICLVFSAIFLSLLIFSHNILALMFAPFGLIYTFFMFNKLDSTAIKKIFLIFIFGIAVSAIFWLPALTEKKFVRGLEVYDYSTSFPEFYQLIFPSWGSGFSGGDLQNQLSYQIGIANLIALFMSFLILLKKKIPYKKLIILFLASSLFVFFLMLQISDPLWRTIPLISYFQFPWRLLSLEILICSFLAGSVAYFLNKRVIHILLIVLSISLGFGYANFAYYQNRSDAYYIEGSNFIDGTNSPGNAFNTLWAGNLKKQRNDFIFPNGRVLRKTVKNSSFTFETVSNKDGQVIMNVAYFPGWKAYVDNRMKGIKVLKEGNFEFYVPKGKHLIQVRLENTAARTVGSLISGLSLLGLLFILFKFVRIKK